MRCKLGSHILSRHSFSTGAHKNPKFGIPRKYEFFNKKTPSPKAEVYSRRTHGEGVRAVTVYLVGGYDQKVGGGLPRGMKKYVTLETAALSLK